MWAAPTLIKLYKKEMLEMMQEGYDLQMGNIMKMIKKASENNLDIYIEMNPEMASNMVAFSSGNYEEEEEKVNPFKVVEDEED